MSKNEKEIIEKLGILGKLEQNLRKSVNQALYSSTLQGHLEKAIKLYEEIDELLVKSQDKIPDKEFFTYLKRARNALTYIQEFVKVRVVRNNKPEQEKMTTETPFDVKLAAAILTPYDGDAEKLSAFVDGVKFLQSVATTETQQTTLKLFLLTRISGKARDSLPNNIQGLNIDEIVNLITSNCESKVTIDQMLAKLNAVKEGLPKQQYCKEIEDLCSKLTKTYVRENVPLETAKKLATKASLDTLIKLVPNNNAKLVLQAGTFKAIEDAIQRLNELPDGNGSNSNINRVFNLNANRIKHQGQQRGSWRRGTYNNINNGHSYQGQQFSRIYFADNQISPPMQNVPFNSIQGMQNQGQPNYNMTQQYQQSIPQQNQAF